MVSKCARIPVKLQFAKDFQYTDKFIDLFMQSNFFSILCDPTYYNKSIIDLIMKDNNPNNFISSYEPFYKGCNCIIIDVTAEEIKTNNILFVYNPEINDASFLNRSTEITEQVLSKNLEIIRKGGKLKFLNRYIGSFENNKDLANAHFLMCEYQIALNYYLSIRKEYPDMSERMVEWCKILLNQTNDFNFKYYDLLILHNKTDMLYSLLNILSDNIKIGIEYWLIKQNLPMRISFLISYSLFIKFLKVKNLEKIDKLHLRFKQKIENKIENSENYERYFWNRILIIFNEQIKENILK